MFLKKIKNNFLVCDQHKIMQRIVCFLSSSKILVYPPCKTLPLNLLISLAFFNFQISWSTLYLFFLHPRCSVLSTLQSGFIQHCSETFLSELSVTDLNDFFLSLHPLSFSISATFYTIEQHFLDSVSSLEDVVICHKCEYSHIDLKIYLKNCALRFCLQSASESHP